MDSVQQRIVIVGGGTAGWMTAACFAKTLPAHTHAISLVESEDIGTVGVGEATIPPIINFNNYLGLDEAEFMRATHASVKLGIDFTNWKQNGHSYFHPFGQFGAEQEGFPFQHFWLKDWKQLGGEGDLGAYNLETLAARAGKFARLTAEKDKPGLNYAYHFDASLYAQYLRRYAEQRGVSRREGRIIKVHQNSESGDVTAVELEGNRRIEGDIFIDCTGFRGLLIEETLKAGYKDWSHWLPVNRAVAVPCARIADITPYTRSTARESGWQWRIPLQHRTGNGYVFCNSYVSEDEATDKLMSRLDGEALADPRVIRFTTGHRKSFWSKNVVALGLASGFIEPLESTSIHLIQTAMFRFLTLLPRGPINPMIRDTYNADVTREYTHIKDFIIAHYKLTEREDTPFWAYVRNMDIPDSLKARLDFFKAQGQVNFDDTELFREPSWLAVLTGQGLIADSYHPVVERLDDAELRLRLNRFKAMLKTRLEPLPSHEAFLRRHCASEALEAYAAAQ